MNTLRSTLSKNMNRIETLLAKTESHIRNDNQLSNHTTDNELKSLEKRLEPLLIYNKQHKHTLELLNSEIAEVDRSIENFQETIQEKEKQKQQKIIEVDKLKFKHDEMISEINKLRLMIKASKTDEENTLRLIETLTDELEDFKNEKTIALDKIKQMKEAIKVIASEKEKNLPKLKKYDSLLKRAYSVFQETESRMDLSIKLKKLITLGDSNKSTI